MNTECISKINKIGINHSTKTAMEEINSLYQISINEEVKNQYGMLHANQLFLPDDSFTSKELAKGHQISCGLFSSHEFQQNYSVTLSRMSLEAAINPFHKNYLMKSFQKTILAITSKERNALSEIIHPKVFDWLDLKMNPDEIKLSSNAAQKNLPQLRLHHVLALVDYCNSQTGSFNCVNDALRVWQMSGSDTFARISSCLISALDEALETLSLHEKFRYEGPAYKGLVLANGAGPYRLAHMQVGMTYVSPHWLSATTRPESSYASDDSCYSSHAISTNVRDTQLTIVHTKAVKVHLFNDISSIDQGEIMISKKPFEFLSPKTVDAHVLVSGHARNELYCKMKNEDLCAEENTASLRMMWSHRLINFIFMRQVLCFP